MIEGVWLPLRILLPWFCGVHFPSLLLSPCPYFLGSAISLCVCCSCCFSMSCCLVSGPSIDVVLTSSNCLTDFILCSESCAAEALSCISALAACRKGCAGLRQWIGHYEHFNFLRFNMHYILFKKSLRWTKGKFCIFCGHCQLGMWY